MARFFAAHLLRILVFAGVTIGTVAIVIPHGPSQSAVPTQSASVTLYPLRLDVTKPQKPVSLDGNSKITSNVVFSTDCKFIAAACEDKTLRVWDTATGKERRVFGEKTDAPGRLTLSPDGKALGYHYQKPPRDGLWFIDLWDVVKGKKTGTLGGFQKPVCSLVFSPDGKVLATGSEEQVVTFWNVATHKSTVFSGGSGVRNHLFSTAFSQDGRMLAVADISNWLCLYEIGTGKLRTTLYPGGLRVAFSPDGKLLATGVTGGITLWNISSEEEVAVLKGSEGMLESVRFSPDGKMLLAETALGDISVWHVASATKLASFQLPPSAAVEFGPTGKIVLATPVQRTISMWDNPLQAMDRDVQKLIEDLGNANPGKRANATKRLAQIGPFALESLLQAAEKGDALTRKEAVALVASITLANAPPIQAKSRPVKAAGLEFTLVTDKDWPTPPAKQKVGIPIWLEVRNTADKACLIYSSGISLFFRDEHGVHIAGKGSALTANLALPTSPPLYPNKKLRLPVGGVLESLGDNRLRFVRYDGVTWRYEGLTSGKYQVGALIENTKKDQFSGFPLWIGKAEPVIDTIVLK